MSKARCKNCEDIVESKTRHEWVCCSCFRLRIGMPHGFFLDGGDDYIRVGGNQDDIEWIDPIPEK